MARTQRRYEAGEAASWTDLAAPALRRSLRGYSPNTLRADVLAGLVVGVVALPLSMALSIAVGAPPQNGLYTAIVAGLVAAVFGGSRMQVTGPTAAFIVILAPIHAEFGMAGLLVSGALAGVLLVGMGLLRMGRLVEFISHPVTTGFSAGIGTVIAILQLEALLGVELAEEAESALARLVAVWHARGGVSPSEMSIGFGTLALLLGLPRVTRRVPAPVVAIPAAALVSALAAAFIPGFEVATIGTEFQTPVGDHVVAGIPRLPPMPLLPWTLDGGDGAPLEWSVGLFRALLPGAFAIAILGAIESLLSAVVADGMAGTRHDPDAELVGQGLANIVAPFFGGIPATGALARTATNVRSGGRSPISSVVHALTVLAAILLLAPLVSYLPMAAMAALLLVVAWNMAEARHVLHILRVAPRADVAVLVVCYVLTVTFDMVIAVGAGVMLASLLFMRRMAAVTQTRVYPGEPGTHGHAATNQVLVYEVSGPLFFGAAQQALAALDRFDDATRAVVLSIESVPFLDATGLVALESAIGATTSTGRLVVIAGAQEQPAALLRQAGIVDAPDRHVRVAATLADAMPLANAFSAHAR